MIEIREVKTRKERKQFVNFPLKLYKGNKSFVPPMYGDEMKVFRKDYLYYDTSEAKYWNAYKDGKMVGRISAIWQKAANEKWGTKKIRFTRFDSIDDQEVANALFKAAEDYARSIGMNEVNGPLGFCDLEREGLLIEGFQYLNTFEEQFNYPYYQKLIENCGYVKDVDWIEHRLFLNEEKANKVIDLGERLMKRYNLHFVPKMSLKKFAKLYGDRFFKLYDKAYENIYSSVPFTDNMKNLVINGFAPVINMNYLNCLVDENDNIIALALTLPAIGRIFQKSGGHLYPWTIVKLLHEVKHPRILDLGFVATLPEYAAKGGTAIIYGHVLKQMLKDKIEYVETNLNLEDNKAIISTWDHFDHITHKRRRSFIKKLD